MKTDRNAKTTNTQIPTSPSVRISVQDFGPIANGTINLRPLTVFVGPSNTGKTYFATLIYALHRMLDGFQRLPVAFAYQDYFEPVSLHDETVATDIGLRKEELQESIKKLETVGRAFRFLDLPRGLRDAMQAALKKSEALGAHLGSEFERCLDLKSLSDLARLSCESGGAQLSLDVSEDKRPLWHFSMGFSESGITTSGRIENIVLSSEQWWASTLEHLRDFRRFSGLVKERMKLDSSFDRGHVIEFFNRFLYATGFADKRGDMHYLPAARSSIMQSHRLIASSLVARSTRAGQGVPPEFPTLPGIVADFMQQLILFTEGRERDELIKTLADALEREVLEGQIQIDRAFAGGYPEFVYQPRETKETIRLTRASSMVSELAPVVLFLRGVIDRGDTLIIEEPEAHLHPAAQTQMAKFLGRLVRAGVRVVVTTHSDWLLKEIGNLVREGELNEKTGKPESEDLFPSSLQPIDVGVWQFRKDGTSKGATVEEIPYDRIEGVEPEEYEDVAEELYNRSAGLQNRLAETSNVAKYSRSLVGLNDNQENTK